LNSKIADGITIKIREASAEDENAHLLTLHHWMADNDVPLT